MGLLAQIDPEIRGIVVALNEADLETDWSCQGGPGHWTIRPVVQIRTSPFATHLFLCEQKAKIEKVMEKFKNLDYWLSLVYTYGRLDSHGGEPTWLLQWPTQEGDYLSLPAPLKLEE